MLVGLRLNIDTGLRSFGETAEPPFTLEIALKSIVAALSLILDPNLELLNLSGAVVGVLGLTLKLAERHGRLITPG